MKHPIIYYLLISLIAMSCRDKVQNDETAMFQLLTPKQTNIRFVNQLVSTEEFNTYTFRNFYNGAGVALGDINNDGLIDIYFAGNSVDNKLYLNKGNFQFEDITTKAGVACAGVWSTGVSMADINGDGWLDIYVCKSGPPGGMNRYNELFINNQDGTFSEQAKTWGIADEGLSVHAVFFDYDKDGDLDCYLLNNSLRSIGTGSDLDKINRSVRDPQGGNKLYRNDGNRFTDVSEPAGIYGSAIGFGLGVTIGDINSDGWQDIYVSNDFFEKDYLYINQQDGTFKEDLENWMREISMGSMGADMADLNNDGLPEIFVTEMLPATNDRYKTKAQFENWDTYQRKVASGYYHQFGRNVLQLNNGDGTFSEIGRLTNTHATDWSWGALIFDMDSDGKKDIFIANGIYKDLLDQDYVNFYSNPERVREIIQKEQQAVLKLIEAMPSQALANYAFHNEGDLVFTNQAEAWGLSQPSFSNGAAYADLDNDGDLDLVINNVNMPPFIYNNLTKEQTGHQSLSITLQGEGKNTFGLGAQVFLYSGNQVFYQEQAPMRGFQSCVDHRLHFGLGDLKRIDSLVVLWNGGKKTILTEVATNQLLTIRENEAIPQIHSKVTVGDAPIFTALVEVSKLFKHEENNFSDFNRDRLLFQMLSAEGPKIAVGDVNGDGLDDFYIGGAKDQSGALFVQLKNGNFQPTNQALFEQDKISEDTDALFFDADGDGDLDLYVASGGSEFPESASALIDRLYFNDGKGNFKKSNQILPAGRFESTACVKSADFDGDGDLDLFVGIRLRPFLYGVPNNGYLLENDGKGNFTNRTKQLAPELENLGLITDAAWLDANGDGTLDLIVAGEWMPLTLLSNQNGTFRKQANAFGETEMNGFWNCLKVADLNNDGQPDLVVGNHGLNSRLRASSTYPIRLYINDFDQNGTVEQVLTQYEKEIAYPLVLRNDLLAQLPELKKKYLKFEQYQAQTMEDMFTIQQLEKSIQLSIHELRTMVFFNQKGSFTPKLLPIQAQFSPNYGIEIADFDGDGHLDILLGGNFYRSKPELGIYDASYGVFLKGNSKGDFQALSNSKSGLLVKGEIRDFAMLNNKKLLVARNNDTLLGFSYSSDKIKKVN